VHYYLIKLQFNYSISFDAASHGRISLERLSL
jgi:hypothetical protein